MVVDLPFLPSAVSRARAVVRQAGSHLPGPVVDDAELLASELVSNAVVHGAPDVRLTVTAHPDALDVGVRDGSSVLPRVSPGPASADAAHGRGLRIVQRLAQNWGVAPSASGNGKTVWFRLEAGPGSGPTARRAPATTDREGTP
ncbi:ATP-binding protein [Nocardioides sp. GY 10113]|uniref:ATP-binding protein n=1 Tax=Nocardioides sp. GY 10113 TaxID=2569761 RepID=UPI001F0E0CB4|nr:ATP-binding protein [Nocardioides sp. GY 10113]